MKAHALPRAVWGIVTEIAYAAAIIACGLLVCAAFSPIR